MLLAFGYLPGHKIIWLGAATAGCLLWLSRDSGLGMGDLLRAGNRPNLWHFCLRVALAASAVLLLTLLLVPDQLFGFPKRRPLLWLAVFVLYPLLSAFPQELIYRGFFFRRYETLFPRSASLMAASAAAFAWMHVVYDNAPALILSLIGGLVFADTYRKTGSLFWTSLEHAVYGLLVFSIGLGRFFYEGPH